MKIMAKKLDLSNTRPDLVLSNPLQETETIRSVRTLKKELTDNTNIEDALVDLKPETTCVSNSIFKPGSERSKGVSSAKRWPNLENMDSTGDNKSLKTMLRDRLLYISHPSISNLECSINLKIFNANYTLFDTVVRNILLLTTFNPEEVSLNPKTFSLVFKDVAAMKLLNIIFKDNENHPLYPNYLHWIGGSDLLTFF